MHYNIMKLSRKNIHTNNAYPKKKLSLQTYQMLEEHEHIHRVLRTDIPCHSPIFPLCDDSGDKQHRQGL